MERTIRSHALRVAVAAGLGLCLSLPLAAQDMTETSRLGTRADKVSTGGNRTATSQAGDQRFLAKATKANEKEVASATLGQQKASAPDVRQYATHLLRDHQDMLVKLDETAVALGVSTNRRYVAMAGWGSGMRDGTDPHPAQDNIASSSAGPGSSNVDSNSRTGGPSRDLTAAAGGDTGDDLANSTGSAVGQGGTAGKAVTGAGSTTTRGTVTGRTTGTTSGSTAGVSGATSAGASTTYGGTTASTDSGVTAQVVPDEATNDPAVRKLANLSGAQFDRAFVSQMVADHKKSIAEFERASKDQTLSPQSRELAATALPKLRNHLAMAETLRVNLQTSAQ